MEHLRLALELPLGPGATGFEDVFLVHNAVPELELNQIELGTEFLGRRLQAPLLINAMSGGINEARDINESLAMLAAEYGLGMAVGSQIIGVEEDACLESFQVVRQVNPGGLVLANVSALAKVSVAMRAVEMVEADGLQVHLNVPQELAMAEGDRKFRGVLDNIHELVERLPVPVIVKEVGFGMSREVADKLISVGVKYLDIGGHGGTNFIAIENERGGLFDEEMALWGIPTAVSLIEVLSLNREVKVIATGGISSPLRAAKALGLGADLVGVAGILLKVLQGGGREKLSRWMDTYLYRLKAICLMTGARTPFELRRQPIVIVGKTAEWLRIRGIDVSSWGRRQ
ncbi:type 2 isopentenyl-diphosphate Delta-isomerase [Syntrophothermus sp.]|uniref:type 2 isopentenyl-diphosphate Delta-isomerase n=1 Tax=Syntrophothermus sp. TaxID=2736299 RepID=UPI00257D4A8C|nr:type 2 isopentenyl-diphosphate Delta-isomerase [Syntrophothermus sp.]